MDNNKIPCIRCNKKLFAYIKPYLDKWGYESVCLTDQWERFPLLIINLDGNVGDYTNEYLVLKDANNRELVDNVEEFLYRAAQLKGFSYKKKDNMFTKKDLKTGMVVKTRNNIMWLVLNNKLISDTNFCVLSWYNEDLTTKGPSDFDIVEVYDKVECWSDGLSKGLSYVDGKEFGTLVWKRKEIKEVTMQEIADILNIPVDELRIKK